MTIVTETETELHFDFDHEELFEKIAETVTEAEACPFDISVSLFITDNDGIRELNRENRGIDEATDVLSFPLLSFKVPAAFSELMEDPDNFDPDSGELLLGDIVISQDKVFEQAEMYGHSVRREFAFLVVHSMLHLSGYDHMTDQDRELMESRQNEIMRLLDIPRV